MTQQCVNCPGAEDHSTAQCPVMAEASAVVNQQVTAADSLPAGAPDGYMPIPTAEQIADALESVRCFHDMSAELIAPELLANLLAAPTVKPSFADDPRKPHELSAAGCRCVRFGEGNPHWLCPIHAAPTVKAEQGTTSDKYRSHAEGGKV